MLQDFDNDRFWTASPISNFIEFPLKFTAKRSITDTGETGVSYREEENLPATCLWLDVKADSTDFGEPPNGVPFYGNLTFARVDGKALDPVVLDFTFGLIRDISEKAKKGIAGERTRVKKREMTGMGRIDFRSQVFHEGFECLREQNEGRKGNIDWRAIENLFVERVVERPSFA